MEVISTTVALGWTRWDHQIRLVIEEFQPHLGTVLLLNS